MDKVEMLRAELALAEKEQALIEAKASGDYAAEKEAARDARQEFRELREAEDVDNG